MNKTLKIVQCLFLSGVILITSQHKAEAFFPIPPLPPSLEVDIPGNVGKLISNLKAVYRKVQTIASELNSINLDAIQGCVTSGKGCEELKKVAALAKKYKGMIKKAPGKGKIKENAELGIAEGDVNEFNYYNAYQKLFFIYPSSETVAGALGGKIDNSIIQAAYKSRAVEYRQDVLVDTYLAGKLTESYLFLVEKTINRLDMCQKGLKEGKECVFFGMQMEKVGTDGEKPDPNTPSAGQIGAVKNAYIVTVVYDRLMRIVEDLTATEAIYRASKQIDLATPVTESNAAKYTGEKYHYAYTDTHEGSYAAGLVSKTNRLTKDGGGSCEQGGKKGCPGYNDAKASLVNLDDTEILERLQPIDDFLDKAILLHNFKVQLPDYKTQYRKYLKSIDIHKRTLKALEDSDKCIIEFLNNHGVKPKTGEKWAGNITAANDYESRQGISRELIEEYQKSIDETIIGTTSACPNFYESCPDGYFLDSENTCEDGGKVLYACSVKTIEGDTGNDAEPKGTTIDEISRGVGADDDSDEASSLSLLEDANGADKIDQSNRLREEETWQIGSKKMLDLTANGVLKFSTWNDQQQLQQEYLRNKYRNIKLIIQSTDQGLGAYQIATSLTANPDEAKANAAMENINKYISAISSCMSMEDALKEAKKEFCSESSDDERDCEIKDNEDGTITGTKEVLTGVDEDGNEEWEEEEKTWNQKASLTDSSSCEFTQASQTLSVVSGTGNCKSNKWDLTMGFLVKNYLPRTLLEDKCTASTPKTFHKVSEGKGRVVAKSKLRDVLDTREREELKMKKLVQAFEDTQEIRKNKVKELKAELSEKNAAVDKAQKTKNTVQKELNRSIKRLKAIRDDDTKSGEWYELEDKKATAKELLELNTKPGEEKESLNSFYCTNEKQQLLLEFEMGAINGKSEKELKKAWSCPASCAAAAKEKGGTAKEIEEREELLCKENLHVANHVAFLSAKINETDKNEDHYVNPKEAENRIASEASRIQAINADRNRIKEKIKDKEKEIEDKAREFAKQYLAMAEENQRNIEESNKIYEDFLEKSEDGDKRMEDANNEVCLSHGFLGFCTESGPKPYVSDNLSATIIGIYKKYGLADSPEDVRSQIKDIVIDDINKIWKVGGKTEITKKLKSLGIPTTFYTDGSFNLAEVGILGTTSSAAELGEIIVDAIIKAAAEEITEDITTADRVMKEEVEKASKAIEDYAKSWDICTECPNPSGRLIELLLHENYDAGGAILDGHNKLVKSLREPTAANKAIIDRAGMDLGTVFGIPTGTDIETLDKDYFVGLPARGTDAEAGKNDGRDFHAPKRPLAMLPPVREVFYFSSLDYQEIPQDDGKPSIPHLLNKKYPDDPEHQWEYLPEVWRYLLARPNLRKDGKYFQTFVERSFKGQDLYNQLENQERWHILNPLGRVYRTIIARGGVYPCWTRKFGTNGNKIYIDITAFGDNVGDMEYKIGNLPEEYAAIGECKEIAYNSAPDTSCYTYNYKGKFGRDRKGGVCQLMADHGENNEHGPYIDVQEKLGDFNTGMYITYSELGQLLTGNLEYRPLQRELNEFLSSDDDANMKNTIHRQRAEVASYKRNLFGSFLDAVNAEHTAKKSLDTMEEEIKATLKSLCRQIHDNNQEVGGEGTEGDAADTSCADHIKSHGGLASSGEDNVYGEEGEYNDREQAFKGVNCSQARQSSYYDDLYCKLHEWKLEQLSKAKSKFEELSKDPELSKYHNRVKERLDSIKNTIEILDMDKKEVVYVTPDIKISDMDEKLKNATTDRTAARKSDNDGIIAMDNQSQVVPYCPVYRFKYRKKGVRLAYDFDDNVLGKVEASSQVINDDDMIIGIVDGNDNVIAPDGTIIGKAEKK